VHEEIRGKRNTASLKLSKPFWIEEYEKKKKGSRNGETVSSADAVKET
jgi:hypothetical protein